MRPTAWMPTIVAATAGAAALLVVAAGCDRAQARKPIVLNPSTRQAPTPDAARIASTSPAVTAASSRPSTTRAAKNSYMNINGVWVEFPPAKLIVSKDGDKIRALLCSNDPPEVISPTYQGNRYSFEMMLEAATDIKNLREAEFVYQAPSQELQETSNGIFLDGDRQHLQPYDIKVTFDQKDGHVVAEINGQFVYQTKVERQVVAVYAPHLSAKPEYK